MDLIKLIKILSILLATKKKKSSKSKFHQYELLKDLPDLRNSVPEVSCTKAAALSQQSWRLPNVGHSVPSFFNSPNKATN